MPIAEFTADRSPQSSRIAGWGTAIALAATLGLVVIPVRVAQLMLAPSPQLAESLGDGISGRSPLVRRGDLYDRRGRLLATTTNGYRAFLDPSMADSVPRLGVQLQAAIGIPAVDVDAAARGKADRRYIPLPGLLEDWQVERLRTAPIPGVGIEQVPVRHYPHGPGGGPLVGMVGFEHTGLSGLEHALQASLEPDPGHIRTVRDAARRTMWLPPDGCDPGRDGNSVTLSIDLFLQQTAEDRLHEAVEALGAAGARAVMIDPHSGELLAVAAVSRSGTASPDRLQRNRCVTDPYEPGSTFKPFVWATATAHGLATPDEPLATPTSGPHRTTFGRAIRDSHPRGPSSWRETLVHSLNSGMAIVAERLSHAQMQAAVVRFGFGRDTGCGIPGETSGIVTGRSAWTQWTQTSVAMGHEIAVTPVQMARAFCVFATGGLLPPATIRAIDAGQEALTVRVIDQDTAALTRSTMESVMADGTGRRARSDQYTMFGKSGTAQLPMEAGGGYHEDRYVSSFIAGAPAANPSIVVLCVIDDPDRSLGRWYGGSTAGPVVRDLVDAALPYLGVAPDRHLVQAR